jgi:DNA end-binding protein Ku
MRSIWKGSIAFGLVNVPVKVYSATEDHDIKFHQVHAKDNGRIRYKRVCEVCGEVVEYRDIAKAFESDDGQMVVITDEDIATLPEERSREIEVLEFVPASDIDPMMYDKSYFLEPDGKSSKSYVLLTRTLKETDRVAIVHFALRNKTRLAALRVQDFSKRDVMIVQTLLWPDEIRDPDFPVLDKEVDVKPAELKMASQVVESMTDDFNPDRYHDDYQEHLHELVQAKLEGGEAFTTEEQPKELDETEDVSDLLAKLEASVKARRAGGGSDGEKGPCEKGGCEEDRREEDGCQEVTGQESRGEEVATRADPPAAPRARRVFGAARRPSDEPMRGHGRTHCPPPQPRPHVVRWCRSDRRKDRTARVALPGSTAHGATR